MARALVLLLFVACAEPVPAPVVSDLPGARILDQALRGQLSVPDALPAMLPLGPRTPVLVWRDPAAGPEESADRGIVLSVSDAAAGLTARGLRRQLASTNAVLPPIVFLDGPASPGRTRVVVVTVAPSPRDAVLGSAEPHETLLQDDLAELVDRWGERAGLSLHAVTRTHVTLDLEKPPADPRPLVDELVVLAGHLHADDDAARRAFTTAIGRQVVEIGR